MPESLLYSGASRMMPKKDAKLVIAIMTGQAHLVPDVVSSITEHFGMIQKESHWYSFSYTQYYEEEMGKNLKKYLVALSGLRQEDELADIKITTNALERKWMENETNRTVNLDPGLIFLDKFVLASTKRAPHRLYASQNIYAELTLIYQDKKYRPLPWTYPDFCRESILEYLSEVRNMLKKELKDENTGK